MFFMRIRYLESIILSSVIMLLACGKPDLGPDGLERKGGLSSDESATIEKNFVEQRALIEEARGLKAKAEGGDPVAAKRWRVITSDEFPVNIAYLILNRVKKSVAVEAKSSQLASIRKEMSQVGWNDIRPIWISAKLGDADAQNEIYDFFVKKKEHLNSDERVFLFRLKGSAKISSSVHYWRSRPDDELPQIEVLDDSCRQVSYSYLVDSFWTPPEGAWDPLYVEGRYRYDGIEFAPRDWLVKAAATDSEYRTKLAALDFVSANNDTERIRAAKVLLSLVGINRNQESRSLVESCLAAIYYRGITVPVDHAKAAEIMLSSSDNALKARGVKLVCEKNLPLEQQDRQSGHESEELLNAVYNKYGYGNWRRDFERAYFEYWIFLWRINGSPGGDANFARMELAELEKQLSAEEIISLQKKCWVWYKKFDGKSPYIDDWVSR